MTALPAMRAFKKPILLIWGEQDENFGPKLARRLTRDIPGIRGISYTKNFQQLPMIEEHEAYLSNALAFLLNDEISLSAINTVKETREKGEIK